MFVSGIKRQEQFHMSIYLCKMASQVIYKAHGANMCQLCTKLLVAAVASGPMHKVAWCLKVSDDDSISLGTDPTVLPFLHSALFRGTEL